MTNLSFELLCSQFAVLFCLECSITDITTSALVNTVAKVLFNFYVDDGLFSFSTIDDLIIFFKQIVPLLLSCGLSLTIFFTNCEKFAKLITELC